MSVIKDWHQEEQEERRKCNWTEKVGLCRQSSQIFVGKNTHNLEESDHSGKKRVWDQCKVDTS